MKTILIILALFLAPPVVADEKRPEFKLMEADDIVRWYELAVTHSILEDTEHMHFLSILTISQDVPCVDVKISTEPIQHWNIYSPPTWYLSSENCVDKRIYNCEENNGK